MGKEGQFSKCGPGNKHTLNRENIRTHVLKYFNTHYSANIMTLCIVSNHALDVMEQLVVSDFSQIKNKEVSLVDYS